MDNYTNNNRRSFSTKNKSNKVNSSLDNYNNRYFKFDSNSLNKNKDEIKHFDNNYINNSRIDSLVKISIPKSIRNCFISNTPIMVSNEYKAFELSPDFKTKKLNKLKKSYDIYTSQKYDIYNSNKFLLSPDKSDSCNNENIENKAENKSLININKSSERNLFKNISDYGMLYSMNHLKEMKRKKSQTRLNKDILDLFNNLKYKNNSDKPVLNYQKNND